MLKTLSFLYKCSQLTSPPSTHQLETVLSYYKSGKSTISISQHLVQIPSQPTPQLYPNFYINLQNTVALSNKQLKQIMNITDNKQLNTDKLIKIYRVITNANIKNNSFFININQLISNPFITQIISFKQNHKFVTKTSQIIINTIIQSNIQSSHQKLIQQTITSTQKSLSAHIDLPISYMISKNNVLHKTWFKLLNLKKKAIHSNVVQCFINNSSNERNEKQKKFTLQQLIYDNGFKLQHIFLKPYSKGSPIKQLINNDSFNLQELLKILRMIDFQGKLILQHNDKFYQNIQYLDTALKKCGYQKKKTGKIDLIDEYMIF